MTQGMFDKDGRKVIRRPDGTCELVAADYPHWPDCQVVVAVDELLTVGDAQKLGLVAAAGPQPDRRPARRARKTAAEDRAVTLGEDRQWR